VEDCKDERERRLLAYLVPILHPKKPTSVPITVASTILSSYAGEREVGWSRVVRDIVVDLIKGLGASRPSPLCPFLFHLYQFYNVLLPVEVEIWNEQLARRARGEPDVEELVVKEEKEKKKGKESLGAAQEQVQPSPLDSVAHRTRSKAGTKTKAHIQGDSNYSSILPQLNIIRTKVAKSEKVLQEFTKLAGGCQDPSWWPLSRQAQEALCKCRN
jgi:hypothetical protein